MMTVFLSITNYSTNSLYCLILIYQAYLLSSTSVLCDVNFEVLILSSTLQMSHFHSTFLD